MKAGAWFFLISVSLAIAAPSLLAQEPLVVRPPPPPLEDFEIDADGDGVADGWYNIQDAKLFKPGKVGSTCLRFENAVRGLPSRASRAFGIDGKKYEAIVIGLWVRAENVRGGDRVGTEPTLMIDFLGENIKSVRRASIGPWRKTPNASWIRVASRLPVPETTTDAILTVGLLGATGILEIDGMTFDLVPRGGKKATNLILNGDFELGTVAEATHWVVDGVVHRASPGHESDSAMELPKSGGKLIIALGVPTGSFGALEILAFAKGQGLRQGGAQVAMFFLDSDGESLPGVNGSALVGRFSGSFPWGEVRKVVNVPAGAERIVLQFERTEGPGSLKIDDIRVTASPEPGVSTWTPYSVKDDEAAEWPAFAATNRIESGSALDASGLLTSPAGTLGFVKSKGNHLYFEKGPRARFFGVVALPPLAFVDSTKADLLADRLARSGVNLVRFDDLDTALGPGRSLIDDARDDTKVIDPVALGRFEHLIAALKARGIYIALEIQAARLYRDGDGMEDASAFPVGGGPAVAFDPKLKGLAVAMAKELLGHVNPETKLALKDDPTLAWVVISGQQSLFDLIDNPDSMPRSEAALLTRISEKRPLGSGPKLWHVLEAEQWKGIADDLRKFGVKVPIAGCSHWRREPEFAAAQATSGLDLIDDRLYWNPPPFGDPSRRSMLFDKRSSFSADSVGKKKLDRPYVVGQWAAHTFGAWAQPFEAADLLLTANLAATADWDGIARRGLFLHPEVWGEAAPGTAGDRDSFAISEVVNANPAVFAMLPHASSILLHASEKKERFRTLRDPGNGRLLIQTSHTLALAGWNGRQTASAEGLTLRFDASPHGVIAASSLGPEPLSSTHRLLISAIARVQPTGLRWSDHSRRIVADPGVPPLRQEPLTGSVAWKKTSAVHAYALDNEGKRVKSLPIERSVDGSRVVLDGAGATVHWELVAD